MKKGMTRRLMAGLEQLETRTVMYGLPVGFSESLFVGDIASPTRLAIAPDDRFFVTERGGNITVIKDGAKLNQPFASLDVITEGECGLLGITFDPNFASNGYVYVFYTTDDGGAVHNRVSRLTADGDVMAPGSELVLFELDNQTAEDRGHNGGAIEFGADGKLYISSGENYHSENAQSMETTLGKILRINSNGTIPTDNPFYNSTTGNNRAIWALGVRNPFHIAVQPGTGKLYINDVGGRYWEEINEGVAGANYGWPTTEGVENVPGFEDPVYAYPHNGGGAAITGGAFYNPSAPGPTSFPQEYLGDYLFSDFVSGWIHRFDPISGEATPFYEPETSDFPLDVDVGADGSLYYVVWNGSNPGRIMKIEYTAAIAPPTIVNQSGDKMAAVGETVTFEVEAGGAEPLTFQWKLNDVDIPGATSNTYTTDEVDLTDSGDVYTVVVTNDFGSAPSQPMELTVVEGTRPSATILLPTNGQTYAAGDIIQFSGEGFDGEDGALLSSSLTWEVVFHHNTHSHPFLEPQSGLSSGSFTIPTSGETATDVWYRIHLTVKDSSGLERTVFRDVVPRTATHTLKTSPAGLQVLLDGQPATSPSTFDSVTNIERTVGVQQVQTLDGKWYRFVAWSDGGAETHVISSPATNTDYMATFEEIPQPVPVVSDFGPDLTYTAGDSAILLSPDVTVSHEYPQAMISTKIRLQIVQNADPADRMFIVPGGRISLRNGKQVLVDGSVLGTYFDGVGTQSLLLNLNLNVTMDRIHAVLHSIGFENTATRPAALDRRVVMRVSDSFGKLNDPVFKKIKVIVPNEAPVITGFGDNITYKENQLPVFIAGPETTITDADSIKFTSGNLTVKFTSGGSVDDQLSIRNTTTLTTNGAREVFYSGNKIGTYTGGTNGTALVVSFNDRVNPGIAAVVLRNIMYSNASHTPKLNRTVSAQVTDELGAKSEAVTKVIIAQAINDLPEISNFGDDISYTEGDSPVPITPPTVTVTDLDGGNFGGGSLTVKLSIGAKPADLVKIRPNGLLSLDGNKVIHNGVETGTFQGGDGANPLVITFTAQANPARTAYLLKNIVYESTSDRTLSGNRRIWVQINDGSGAGVARTKLLTVTGVNDPPVLEDSSTAPVGYTLNGRQVLITTTATVSDLDSPNFNNGKFVVEVTSGQDAGNLLTIGGTLFSVEGDQLKRNGVAIGTIISNGEGLNRLEVALNDKSLPGYVQQLVRAIRFRTVNSNLEDDRTISFTIFEADGTFSDTLQKQISVQ